MLLVVDLCCFFLSQTLLSHGATVNAARTSGATPLHVAIRFKNTDVVNRLIAAGSEKHTKASYITSLRTFFHIVAAYEYLEKKLCRRFPWDMKPKRSAASPLLSAVGFVLLLCVTSCIVNHYTAISVLFLEISAVLRVL